MLRTLASPAARAAWRRVGRVGGMARACVHTLAPNQDGAVVVPGRTGVFWHLDPATNHRLPVWFHCSGHFARESPELAALYASAAPLAPVRAVRAPEEFPVLGTPFMEDNADSDDEGGMGAAELAAAGPATTPAQPAQRARHVADDLARLLGNRKLVEQVRAQVGDKVLAEAFSSGGGGANPSIARNTAHANVMQRTHSHVVVVMHGCLRNAAQYLEAWKPIADRCGLLVLCPQFSAAEFPEYTTGNTFDRSSGSAVPKDQWLFSVVERIFDGLAGMGVHRSHYHIYGHSAGAQFVHRMVMFLPEARIHTAVAANAGWYTLPSHDAPFPYGLHCSGVDSSALREALSKRLVVLLGQEDNKTLHLRRTRRALAQGVTRFDRGLNFFLRAKSVAHDLNIPLQWSLRTVEGVGHVNSAMSVAASTAFGFAPHPGVKHIAGM